jgi:hypothetical protein
MQPVQLESEVGADGVLELRVSLGPGDARKRVVVTIEPMADRTAPTSCGASDWHEFVERTYGSCAGLGLEEPPDLPARRHN